MDTSKCTYGREGCANVLSVLTRVIAAADFGSLDVSVIPDAGHFAILTHTDQVTQHMLDFLGTQS